MEAAWAAARSPGPLRAFFRKIAARRGQHIAAVATARKLAMIIWHMLTKKADYIWARPALLARKLRSVELRAGQPANRAQRGSAYDYNIPSKRAEERAREVARPPTPNSPRNGGQKLDARRQSRLKISPD